ncbi:hypothetical protein EVAR_32909_1 [Eumeta japonica]|uniref:Uncharacterized protein n=1 Tax=Eumeta variegata TaxID=151549 RepID=A0A4C1VRT8_EUMVA|nr:hypothetical protein EVAR_32909_1 [Eumeta japonica]
MLYAFVRSSHLTSTVGCKLPLCASTTRGLGPLVINGSPRHLKVVYIWAAVPRYDVQFVALSARSPLYTWGWVRTCEGVAIGISAVDTERPPIIFTAFIFVRENRKFFFGFFHRRGVTVKKAEISYSSPKSQQRTRTPLKLRVTTGQRCSPTLWWVACLRDFATVAPVPYHKLVTALTLKFSLRIDPVPSELKATPLAVFANLNPPVSYQMSRYRDRRISCKTMTQEGCVDVKRLKNGPERSNKAPANRSKADTGPRPSVPAGAASAHSRCSFPRAPHLRTLTF